MPAPAAEPNAGTMIGRADPRIDGQAPRTLVVGWFSLRRGGSATAGDLAACELLCTWLRHAEVAHDVALGDPFPGGVDWERVDPRRYTHVVHVCGPVAPISRVTAILERFGHARRIGVNVSMIAALDAYNPFDTLIERDSPQTARPDLAFAAAAPRVPAVGVVRVSRQPEYGDDGRHAEADAAIDRLLDGLEVARVAIDTRVRQNDGGLRTAAEIESLIARMNTVVTTRLHGLVFALKHGVPALAIDPIARGAKIRHQARVIGWPAVLGTHELDDASLRRVWDFCQTDEARARAQICADRAARATAEVHGRVLGALQAHGSPDIGPAELGR